MNRAQIGIVLLLLSQCVIAMKHTQSNKTIYHKLKKAVMSHDVKALQKIKGYEKHITCELLDDFLKASLRGKNDVKKPILESPFCKMLLHLVDHTIPFQPDKLGSLFVRYPRAWETVLVAGEQQCFSGLLKNTENFNCLIMTFLHCTTMYDAVVRSLIKSMQPFSKKQNRTCEDCIKSVLNHDLQG